MVIRTFCIKAVLAVKLFAVKLFAVKLFMIKKQKGLFDRLITKNMLKCSIFLPCFLLYILAGKI